jgi:hypothetical protein
VTEGKQKAIISGVMASAIKLHVPIATGLSSKIAFQVPTKMMCASVLDVKAPGAAPAILEFVILAARMLGVT